MTKKGQGISINVIIIAAIALVVLVILSTLVIRSGRKINESQTCETFDGAKCITSDDYSSDGCGDGFTRNPTAACKASTQDNPLVCCIRI